MIQSEKEKDKAETKDDFDPRLDVADEMEDYIHPLDALVRNGEELGLYEITEEQSLKMEIAPFYFKRNQDRLVKIILDGGRTAVRDLVDLFLVNDALDSGLPLSTLNRYAK